ncbi:hypothetical protein PsYK624_013540 [Phanerochaete sordida]|uniref:Uncharacterized protein n=1 Tax=Phanerochaete sordida TaxID=48140 RepID=A0A9P3G029_9APHY|nr:hypothetical protein PsYK624_013540 [Phanerochaete sordida]
MRYTRETREKEAASTSSSWVVEAARRDAARGNARIDRDTVTYTTRGCLLVSHTIVLVLTWLKTYSQWREARRCKLNVSVSTCLLRDGTWFFLATLALNVAQIVASSTPDFPVDLFVTTLPAVLFNRFMLNLRSVDDTGEPPSPAAPPRLSRFSSPRFRIPESFLGNIGGPVDTGDGEYVEDSSEVVHTEEHWQERAWSQDETTGGPSAYM